MEPANINETNPQDVLVGAKFIDPGKVLSQMEITPKMKVADFGCGTGYFSLTMARKIKEGVLYAIDILPQMLESIESQAKIQGLNNITTKRANLENTEGSKLDADSLDIVIVKDMLYQNGDKKRVLEEAKRVLRTGGKALVVEWKKEENPIGPELKLRISAEDLKAIIEEVGFSIVKKIDAGNFHYGFLVQK